MPHLSGVFEEFPDLDKVSSQDLSVWLKNKPDPDILMNFLGNRILYPQTIPLSKSELEIDLAILRQAVKLKPALVYDPQRNKLFLPQSFIQRFPNITRLAGVIVQAISPKGVNQIYIKNENQVRFAGTVISPVDPSKLPNENQKVKIAINGVESILRLNTLSVSQISQANINVSIGNQDIKVSGGEIGIIIDLRTGVVNE